MCLYMHLLYTIFVFYASILHYFFLIHTKKKKITLYKVFGEEPPIQKEHPPFLHNKHYIELYWFVLPALYLVIYFRINLFIPLT